MKIKLGLKEGLEIERNVFMSCFDSDEMHEIMNKFLKKN